MNINKHKWGFLRETVVIANKVNQKGPDPKTQLYRTGMEEYLQVIFPDINEDEWIKDKVIPGFERRIRPDYRCEKLKLIIEFDGTQHYKQPDTIRKDKDNQALYEKHGYKVIRIPYFIQLTNDVVKTMFGVDVQEKLFDPDIPSMNSKGRNTPAFCCPAGIKRMAEDFRKYTQQYKVNIDALEKEAKKTSSDFLTGCELLKQAYKNVK